MKVKNKKRELTAKEYADKYNISIATVKRYFSQDREDYENTARIRRKKAYVLREMGMKWKDIGEKLDTTINGAVALYKRYVQLDLAKDLPEEINTKE